MKISLIQSFIRGYVIPFTTVRLVLRSYKIFILTLIPLLINISLYILFFKYGAAWLNQTIASWHATGIWFWILKIISYLILAMIAALSFTVVSSLICSPFNDVLSKQTLLFFGYHPEKPQPKKHGLKSIIGLELKRMSILIVGSIFAIFLGMIPLLQIPALILASYLLAFEYFGYPIAHESNNLASVVFFLFKNPLLSLGYGFFLLTMMALPFASLFYIPLAVMGSSQLYATTKALPKHKKT